MNQTTASERLELYAQPTVDPELSDDELDMLLAEHAVTVDADGNLPNADGWTPTYSTVGVWIAVKEAWLLKAGKAAARFDFATDGQRFQRSQVLDHCRAMADRYARKANQSAPIRSE